MLNRELPRETLETANLEWWERGPTATPLRAFAVRLHATGWSPREAQATLRMLGVERPHQAIFRWLRRIAESVSDPPPVQPARIAIDEVAVKINGDQSCTCTARSLETKVPPDVTLFGHRGTDPAAAFLHDLTGKHDPPEAIRLVDSFEI